MKYFVISKEGNIFDAREYLKKVGQDKQFNNFIRREAFNEIIAEQSDAKPEYLQYAQKFGFSWEENADIGFVNYDYKANHIMKLLKLYAERLVHDIGFPVYEVQGSNIWDLSHPEVDAYAKLFGDRLFQFKASKKDVVMSYDGSYPQFNLAGKYKFSHKDLPFGHFSIADCYRLEQSGECMLLYRQRRFYMPDFHPYFKDVPEAFDWYPRIEQQILKAAKDANRNYHVSAEVSSVENWEKYQGQIIGIAQNLGQDILIQVREDNKDFYWIINVDYKILDKLGQSREIACIQIDVGNGERLGIEYVDEQDKKQNPVIIHAAIPGGIERYLYMIMDDLKNCMPIWLYPIQLRLLSVNGSHVEFCKGIADRYRNQIRIDIDDRLESISKKIKDVHKDFIPNYLVVGDKEVNSEQFIELIELVAKIEEASSEKPYLPMSWPNLVSKQIG